MVVRYRREWNSSNYREICNGIIIMKFNSFKIILEIKKEWGEGEK